MSHTVNKLAKLSGVSVRTLHYYDEIGLLKPAYCGENNYRYYEEQQLLLLQQILFYRELGFQLNDIKKIIYSDQFDKINALESHKNILNINLNQTKNLIKTIDKTLSYLRGDATMNKEELYYGFDSEKQKQYEQELVDSGRVTKKEMDAYRKEYSTWTQEKKDQGIQEGKNVIDDLVKALNNHLAPSSDEVQSIIRRGYNWLGYMWLGKAAKDKYLGMIELYQTPDFKKFYDSHHPDLLQFLVEAMKIFADREFK